jgi:septal ring factor EnvC (AmiA/AmiB activator)
MIILLKAKLSFGNLLRKMNNDGEISMLESENHQSIRRIKELEAQIKKESEAHKAKTTMLNGKLEVTNENFELEKVKKEIAEDEKVRLQKIVDEMQGSREESFSIAAQCCKKLRETFVSIGAFSRENDYVDGDAARM